jgi:hypothetical protein
MLDCLSKYDVKEGQGVAGTPASGFLSTKNNYPTSAGGIANLLEKSHPCFSLALLGTLWLIFCQVEIVPEAAR